MSNAIEVLYFVQQKSPTYIQSMEEELDESLFSSTITASEEAMTVLEEVIMYTFQQCVYYISKCLYVSLPALLECNPFPNPSEGREGWRASPPLPEELRRVVLTYQEVLDLLRQYEVHPEITSQMFAYLFFFSNTLLFNQLLDKGSSLGCFHWSQGVKLRASVRLLLEWLRGAGFEQLAQQFFAKLASVANLLAMPGSQLLQVGEGGGKLWQRDGKQLQQRADTTSSSPSAGEKRGALILPHAAGLLPGSATLSPIHPRASQQCVLQPGQAPSGRLRAL
uniref:Dilute domain-containing protein n=1 Tax=Anas platyrhynchos platyrhynchos TaxID=8840 RepID=A0A493T4Z3_ANAPP